jgi:dTMP kinase
MEGIDGAGKTTQVRMLAQRLSATNVPFITTKEPTDGPWGLKIRESAKTGRMSPREELAAFISDRQEHVREELAPALEDGKVVLVDRYYLSTVAYQGARGLDPADLLAANSFAPAPDLLIVLDIDPKLGLQRIRERGDLADLFEREEELARARSIFKGLLLPNLHFIDARLPAQAIHEIIFSLLMEKLHPSDGESIVPEIELKLRAI